jgi:hypothetical protein
MTLPAPGNLLYAAITAPDPAEPNVTAVTCAVTAANLSGTRELGWHIVMARCRQLLIERLPELKHACGRALTVIPCRDHRSPLAPARIPGKRLPK